MSLVLAFERTSITAALSGGYEWCLNPHLTLREQIERLAEEIDRYAKCADWMQEDCRINCYLFASAIACTVDDALAPAPPRLARYADRIPFAGRAVVAGEAWWSRSRARLNSQRLWRVGRWRDQWAASVDSCCEALLGGSFQHTRQLVRLQLASAARALEPLLGLRMRIPEGFRCQDLAHQDVWSMVDLFVEAPIDKQRPILVIGPRTAGAYFAPVAAAYLRSLGYERTRWVTARPKNGLSFAEGREIRKAAAQGAAVLVVDDHPNTGGTMRLLLRSLRNNSVRSENISVAVPAHPSNAAWTLPEETDRAVRIVMLACSAQYKAKRIDSNWPAQILEQHFAAMGIAAEIGAGDRSREQNARFDADLTHGFQVRTKRLFEVGCADPSVPRRVIAKSVGWGWFGYHAALAAVRLEGFVPLPLFLRDGFLFSEWIEGAPLERRAANEPLLAAACGEYVAARVRMLPLPVNPALGHPECGWSGWDDLLALLRKLPGPYLGRLLSQALARNMRLLVAPQPVLTDGRMPPADWVRCGTRLYKTDFEQHNFGGGELSVVDPAWDLAAASFEFGFSETAEDRMIRSYAEAGGDCDLTQRLLLYKLLYAATIMRAARYWLARRPDDCRAQNRIERYLHAWDFATFALARYQGRRSLAPEWKPDLFFLDIDGVLDRDVLGFPHSTAMGVRSLEMLRSAGFSVVLNTARSLEHVKTYCRAYGLPGGVAELGSVFWDAVRGEEVPFVEPMELAALDRIRQAVPCLPGVFVDPETRFAVRAFLFAGGKLKGLSAEDAEHLLATCSCESIRAVRTEGETLFISAAAGKGKSVGRVKAHVSVSKDARCCAMGDSDQDVDMLAAVDSAFAPRNNSRGVKELIARGACRRMRRPFQQGLFGAALELTRQRGFVPHDRSEPHEFPHNFLDRLLSAPDLSGWRKLSALLSRRI